MFGTWRGIRSCVYRIAMPRGPKAHPVPQPEALAEWKGYWVAVLDDQVIAAAHSPRELAAELHSKGPAAAKAVARYVPESSDVIVIGVG